MIKIIIAVVIAYCMGNISPSTIMARAQGIDIKKEGSGNAGTTNALRVMGKKAGAITLVVDILKGTIAVIIGGLIGGPVAASWCVLAVFVGHVWPIFLKFQGGKGVATAFGSILRLNPLLALICLGIVAVFVFTSKRMSVGSIAGAIAFPILAIFMEPTFVVPAIVMALIIIYKHKGNISRLMKGEEPIMGIFNKDK